MKLSIYQDMKHRLRVMEGLGLTELGDYPF